jgi:hypothetical protein
LVGGVRVASLDGRQTGVVSIVPESISRSNPLISVSKSNDDQLAKDPVNLSGNGITPWHSSQVEVVSIS